MWYYVIPVLITGVFTLGGVSLGNRISNRSQDRRWILERQLEFDRDTAERLWELYARMAQSAALIQSVSHEKWYTLEGETRDERDQKHLLRLAEAQNVIAEVGGRLMIDPDAGPVRDNYSLLRATFDEFIGNYSSGEELHPGEQAQLRQEIGKLAIEVSDSATQHLRSLRKRPELGE